MLSPLPLVRFARRAIPCAGLMCLVLALAACAATLGQVGGQQQPIGTPSPGARFEPRDGAVYLGVSTHLITTGVDGWDKAAGISTHPALYGRWTTPDGPVQPILDEVASRPGIAPIIHWNLPMDNGQVTNGSHDSYIRAQAAAVKAYAKPVFIRLDWEMNATWYPHWNLPAVTPAQYVASWRHVVAQFSNVPNVAFVWAPNVNQPAGKAMSAWYPGDDAVDWIGLDAYPQSAPAATIMSGTDGMQTFASFAETHHKPLMLAEWATNLPHPDDAAPVNAVFDWAKQHPKAVKALVWFDFSLPPRDFRLSAHPVGAAAFRARTNGNPAFLLSVP
jgi:hypothetical protein